MKNKSLTLLLNIAILGALVLGACTPATTVVPPADTVVPGDTAVPEVVATAVPSAMPIVEGTVGFPAQIAEGRDVTIVVVGMPAESNPTGLAAWKATTAAFEAKYPNVKVTGSDYAYAPDTFPALVAADGVPTVYQAYLTDRDLMVGQGVAADLTDLYATSGLAAVYNPNLLTLVSADGKTYGMPMGAYVMGLAYNIKMLKDAGYDGPPTTWADMGPVAQKLTDRANGVAGFSFIRGEAHQAGWHGTVIAYNFGANADTIVTKGADGKYTAGFDNPQTLAALNFIKDIQWKYDALPKELLEWPTNGEQLAKGKAAMVLMAGSQLSWIKSTYPDADMSNFGFAPLPAGPDGKMVSLGGGDVAYISAKSTPDQIEAGFYYRLFVQFDPDQVKAGFEATKTDPNAAIGAPSYPMYTGKYEANIEALTKQYANMPVDNYALFNNATIGLMHEPQISGQDYYAALGDVVSKIVTDQTADPAALLTAAQATFQTNVLDLLK